MLPETVRAAVRAGQDAVFVEHRADIDIGSAVFHTDCAVEFRRSFVPEFQAVDYPFSARDMRTQRAVVQDDALGLVAVIELVAVDAAAQVRVGDAAAERLRRHSGCL